MLKNKSLTQTRVARLLLLSTLLLSPAAFAHGNLDTRPFIDGLLHIATAPLCYAIVWGLVAASVSLKEDEIYANIGMSCVGAILACMALAWVSLSEQTSQGIAAFAAAVLGLTAVAGRRLPKQALWAIAVFSGGAACVAAQLDQVQWQSAAGLITALAFIVTVSFALLRDLARWRKTRTLLPLAQRIAGAWIACIGLLILALTIYPPAR
jgi:threonine/homoserine/homoserine lactone efflux protein